MNPSVTPEGGQAELADDIVAGADAIARYLGMTQRQVYAHVERGNLPFFKLGATICVRKSTMLSWIGHQETSAVGKERETSAGSPVPEDTSPVPRTIGRRSGRRR